PGCHPARGEGKGEKLKAKSQKPKAKSEKPKAKSQKPKAPPAAFNLPQPTPTPPAHPPPPAPAAETTVPATPRPGDCARPRGADCARCRHADNPAMPKALRSPAGHPRGRSATGCVRWSPVDSSPRCRDNGDAWDTTGPHGPTLKSDRHVAPIDSAS